MDPTLRQRVCQLIAGIVITDEDLDPKEEAFVDRMLAKFGLDAGQRDVIFPLVDGDEAAETMRSLPPEVQKEAFGMLVSAAAADGKVVPEERDYLGAVAMAIGMADAEVDRMIQKELG